MKYKYEFEVDDSSGFVKGCCRECPLSYDYEYEYGYDSCCVLYASYDECPLEEVED